MFTTRTCFKAQFTIVALVMILVMLVVYSQLYPVIEHFITDLIEECDPATATLISLIPFFIALAILLSIVWYVVPSGGRR